MDDELNLDPNAQPDDRRRHNRSRLIVDLFFNGADLTGVASTKDISVGGLYMNTQTELPEGSVLTLRIPFDDGDVVVNAEVIYSNPGRGVGVRFQGLRASHRAIMERALADE
ncbi:MAG TPA: PilZ domain-containing protein [Pyrinomonadaceae bacterium]